MNREVVWMRAGQDFPDPEQALPEPNGLLAAGGDLNPGTLLSAYRSGIFPWYSEGQPPLWWSPDPRAVLLPGQLHISRSLKKDIRRANYQLHSDTAFPAVIRNCADNRPDGTWIMPEMIRAYESLHHLGHVHSVELYLGSKLIGGLYGVVIGRIFCGESMFSLRSNASKIAFTCLAIKLFNQGFQAIDCQVENPHLSSMGVKAMPRKRFLDLLEVYRDCSVPWPRMDFSAETLFNNQSSL